MKLRSFAVFLFPFLLFFQDCNKNAPGRQAEESHKNEGLSKVMVAGYNGHAMEPFLSRDGKILFFNNLNSAPEDTNIHWATRIDDLTFKYNGEVSGINSDALDGVPTMDREGNIYFVSTRSYFETFSTIYQANFSEGKARNIKILRGLSKGEAPWVTFDVEVSADGQTLYLSEGKMGKNGIPQTADIFAARKMGENFERIPNSEVVFENVNTGDLEYAAAISEDELELSFTRVKLPISPGNPPQIYYSKRKDKQSAFDTPAILVEAEGFVEAVSFSPNKGMLYFHKKIEEKHHLYLLKIDKEILR